MVLLIKKIIFLQRIAPFKAYATVVDNSNEEPKIRALGGKSGHLKKEVTESCR